MEESDANSGNPARAERISALRDHAARVGRSLRAWHRTVALREVVRAALATRGIDLHADPAPLPYAGRYCSTRLGAPYREVLVGELLDACLDGTPEQVIEVVGAAVRAHTDGGWGCGLRAAEAVLAAVEGGASVGDAHGVARRLVPAILARAQRDVDARRADGEDVLAIRSTEPESSDAHELQETLTVAVAVLGVVVHEVWPRLAEETAR